VTLCAVCTVYKEMRRVGLLVEPQNQGRWFVSGLNSKPLGWFISGFGLKNHWDNLSVVWSQNNWDDFS
jgi:hypothetical protein